MTFKGGSFSDNGILLMAKMEVAQKHPPPLPPPQRVELTTFSW